VGSGLLSLAYIQNYKQMCVGWKPKDRGWY